MENMENAKQPEKKYKSATAIGIVAMLFTTNFALAQFKVPIDMARIAEEFSLSNPSILMSMFTIFGIFLSIPIGVVLQKTTTKRVSIIAIYFVIVGSIIGGFATSGGMLIFSRALEGIGFAIAAVALPALISNYVEPKHTGVAMGFFVCWVPCGNIIAFNLTPALYDLIGWRNIWFIYAGIAVIFSIILHFYFKDPAPNVKKGAPPPLSESVKVVLGNRNFILLGCTFLFYNWMMMSMSTYLVTAATGIGILERPVASFIASIPMILGFVGAPAAGALTNRIGRKRITFIELFCTGIGLILAYAEAPIWIIIGVAIFGLLGRGSPGICLSSVGGILNNPPHTGFAMGVLMTFQGIGLFLATWFYPMVVNWVGGRYLHAALSMGIPLIVICMICIAATKYPPDPAKAK